MAEPDMGAFVVVALIAFGILFLGGINAKLFGGLIAVGLMSGAAMIALSPSLQLILTLLTFNLTSVCIHKP